MDGVVKNKERFIKNHLIQELKSFKNKKILF